MKKTVLALLAFACIIVACSKDENGNKPKKFVAETITVNGVSFVMMPVEGFSFVMGGTSEQENAVETNEKPIHRVVLSNYYISETEVMQRLWKTVMGNNPSNFLGDSLPVENVNFDDCHEFITRLNSLTGRTFRLPTEAEWEFAARGGKKTESYIYSGSDTVDLVAWCMGNCNDSTHIVASKAPNELGLYDMSGNVLEWCEDWYGKYDGEEQNNPRGPETGSAKIVRGGAWFMDPKYSRVSFRAGYNPKKGYGTGLRLVMEP